MRTRTAALALWVLATMLAAGQTRAQDPNFTHVTDILGGWRQLLPLDDLYLVRSNPSRGTRLLTANSRISSSSSPNAQPGSGTVSVVGARMFELPSDVALRTWIDLGQRRLFFSVDRGQATPLGFIVPDFVLANSSTSLLTEAADFNGDGLDEVALFLPGQSGGGGVAPTRALVFRANDRTNPDFELGWGPAASFAVPEHVHPLAMTTATIAGEPRILVVGGNPPIDASCDRRSLAIESFRVDRQSLAISSVNKLVLNLQEPASTCVQTASIAAGRFGTTAHDQVAVAFGGNGNVKVISIAFDEQGTPTQRALLDTGTLVGFGKLKLRTGRFAWSSPREQAALVIGPSGQGSPAPSLRVVRFDENLAMQLGPSTGLPNGDPTVFDAAVGNFDHRKPGSTERDPNLQIAVLSGTLSASSASVHVFDVDPARDFALSEASVTGVGDFHGFSVGPGALDGVRQLATLDFQGRSLTVGAPTKVAISGHLQPDLVLAIPPMHVDFIRDADNLGPTGQPSVVNLTVLPDVPDSLSFSSQFQFTATAASTLSTNNTTSWGYSTAESLGVKVTLGNPEASFFSDEVKVSGQQTHDTTVEDTYDTYQAISNTVDATTGFADHLFFTESRHNVYYYPVIGQKACPADKPGCSEAEKRPLFVQFSGVDLIEHHDSDATTQEWYQPVNEPGNLFSYPWDLDQLRLSVPGLAPLTANPATWRRTDTSTSAYTTTWTAQGTGGHTTGSTDTHSFDVNIAVTAQVGAEGIVTGGISGEYDYGTSDSASNLYTTTGSLDASTGIQVNKPNFGDEVARTYFYDFSGYVLGRQLPSTIFDSKTVTTSSGTPVDIQSVGPLAVAFLADPVARGAPWWRQAYRLPDVGLSHPARWSWSSSQQQVSFNARNPSRLPQNDPFFHMKGLYITGEDGQGPQRTIVREKEIVQLQARVYNFSVASMPTGSTVRVRFYGQRYEDAELVGDSFLIGEVPLGLIPGFNASTTQGSTPNWSLASHPFDTTGRGDQHLVFWVVVWALDGQGNLLTELQGHGLTGNPGGTSFTQITQVPTETYSNNVGLYGTYTPFYVAPETLATAEARAEAGQLVLAGIDARPAEARPLPKRRGHGRPHPGRREPLLLEQHNTVSVEVENTADTPLAAVPVVFSDGDPEAGGDVFDVQRIPRLRAKASHVLRTFFRPTRCGEHEIFVRAGHGVAPHDVDALRVRVTIDVDTYLHTLLARTIELDVPPRTKLRWILKLLDAGHALERRSFERARRSLAAFVGEVEAQRGLSLTDREADGLVVPARTIPGCVGR